MESTWPVSNKKFEEHVNNTNLHYSGLPIGTVIWWSGLAEKRPAGFLLLDGSTYDTTLYSELYAILGTDVLPNYIGRFIKGSTTALVSEEAGLPNITGRIDIQYAEEHTGAFYTDGYNGWGGAYEVSSGSKTINMFDASKGTVDKNGNYLSEDNSPYGKSDTVTPANISAVPLIKAKHYANVYEPGSLDETLRVEHNALKDTVAELQNSLGSVLQNFVGLPDYNNPIPITELPYTCPANGVVQVHPWWTGNGAGRQVYITPKDGDTEYCWLDQNNVSDAGQGGAGMIIAREGDVISANTTYINAFIQFNFFPFKKNT